MFTKKDFYQISADLVDIQIRNHGETRQEIASVLGVSESFVKQVHSPTTDKHYNLIHLFLLTQHWDVPMDTLIPSTNNLNRLERYRTLQHDILERNITALVEVLRKDDLNE